jgi:chemotaxis protein CheD
MRDKPEVRTAQVLKSPPGEPLIGFEHFQRHWFTKEQCYSVKVKPGEFYVTRDHEAIITLLGSCISACVCDPVSGVGGLNHFILPENDRFQSLDQSETARYGVFAMEQLINEILKHGGQRHRLEAKITGGGQMIPGMSDIGDQNIRFVKMFLQTEGIRLISQDVGGEYGRRVAYLPLQNRLLVKRMPTLHNSRLYQAENNFRHTIDQHNDGSEVELF